MNTSAISVPLDNSAHHYAALFAAQMPNPRKGKQIYLNTLAVCAVRSYLKWLAIPSRPEQGDLWKLGMRSLFDIADLVIPRRGKLECRPLLPPQETVTLPPRVQGDLLGYVIVKMTESLRAAQILGFLPPECPELLPISLKRLQSLDHLIDKLHEQPHIRLSQWFQDFFSDDWQPVAARRAVSGSKPTPTSRSRGKVITWQTSAEPITLLLLLRVTEIEATEVEIGLQAYPHGMTIFLPQGLEIKVCDEQERVCMQAQAELREQGLALTFRCHEQECFGIKIFHESRSFQENFWV